MYYDESSYDEPSRSDQESVMQVFANIFDAPKPKPRRHVKVDDALHEVDDWMIMQVRLRRMTAATYALDRLAEQYFPSDTSKPSRFRLQRDGQIIRFSQLFNVDDKIYTYAAIYIEDAQAWFTTGSSCPKKGFPTIDHLLYYYHALSGTMLYLQVFHDDNPSLNTISTLHFDSE